VTADRRPDPPGAPPAPDEFAHLLRRACAHAEQWRSAVAQQPVFPPVDAAELRRLLDADGLPEGPGDPDAVLDLLAHAGRIGSTASAGPRYFGYVIGSSSPVTVAADWLVSAWDQNAALYTCGPAVAVIEEVCARWVVDLLGLPPHTSVGFTTGTQMAAFTVLAAARQHLLERRGWDVAADGLWGAPRFPVIASAQRHATVDRALRYLGLGAPTALVACGEDGTVDLGALRDALARAAGPALVCVQAGNIHTGAVDPLGDVCELVHAHGGWVHVDGAIGLWARASAAHGHLLDGVERADSWTVDGHKWLNVPFDCGVALTAHPAAHAAAMSSTSAYVVPSGERDPMETVPEWSRRARAVPVYAALRALGRSGVAELVDRAVALARRMAARLAAHPGVLVLNDVVLNQVMVRFEAPGRDGDALTREVVDRVQREGTCWLADSRYGDRAVMRISVCSYATDEADVDRSAEAIVRALAAAVAAAA